MAKPKRKPSGGGGGKAGKASGGMLTAFVVSGLVVALLLVLLRYQGAPDVRITLTWYPLVAVASGGLLAFAYWKGGRAAALGAGLAIAAGIVTALAFQAGVLHV